MEWEPPMTLIISRKTLKDKKAVDLLLRGGATLQVAK